MEGMDFWEYSERHVIDGDIEKLSAAGSGIGIDIDRSVIVMTLGGKNYEMEYELAHALATALAMSVNALYKMNIAKYN